MMMVSDSKGKNSSASAVKKAMSATISLVLRRNTFDSSKCKTEAKMATARIKLLRNKREVQVRQMRRDLALLLQSGQEETARIRVEHAIREQKVLAANEIIETFCELIVTRLPIIAKQKDCPADLRECISSLIYASPRCSEIPELGRLRKIFEKKYGKEFAEAAIDLRSESGVNRMLIEKLSVRRPTGEVKLKVLKEIAKEHQVKWDPTESEKELIKPPEEVIEGPTSFVSATSLPVNQNILQDTAQKEQDFSSCEKREGETMSFKNTFSAAKAAAESAEKAIAAAQAAAYLANLNCQPLDQVESEGRIDKHRAEGLQSQNSASRSGNSFPSSTELKKHGGKVFISQSFNQSSSREDDEYNDLSHCNKNVVRGNSCAGRVRQQHSDIKFDDSDGFDSDEEVEMESSQQDSPPPPSRARPRYPRRNPLDGQPPPSRAPPPLPPRGNHEEDESFDEYSEAQKGNVGGCHVHPKLPDYEAFAARFEALRSHRS